MQRPTTPPLYKAPPNVPFHTHLSTWSSPEINAFLTLQRCSHHAKVFEENDITGSVILELGADELKELGVIKVGERVRLLGAIRELKRRSVSSLASVSAKESSLGGSTPASASSFASAIQVQQQQHHQSHTRMTSSPKVYQGNLSEMSRRNNSQSSGIEFQLNGHNTPPTSYQSSGADWSTMSFDSEREGPSGTHGTSGLTRNRSGTGGSFRKLHAARPPPLHLHSSSHGHTGQNSLQASNNQNPANNSSSLSTPQPLPLSAVSEMGSNGSGSHTLMGTQPGSGSSAEWLVSTTSAPNSRGLNGHPGQNAYPAGINGTGSNVPAPQGSSGRLRAPLPVSGSHGLATSNSLNYGRRSPSPALVGQGSQVNSTPLGRKGSNEYMARPLPGLPPLDDSNRMGDHEDFEGPVRKSSAGSIQSRIGGGSFGSTRSGGSDNTRPSTSSGALASQNASTTHRRAGSNNMLSSFPSSSSKSPHPETRRSSNTRPSTTGSGSSVHLYAASQPRPIKEYSPTKASGSPTKSRFNTPSGSYESRGDITPTHSTSKWHGSGSSRSPHEEKGQKSWGTRWNNDKTGTPTLSLEDVKRKLVKFILVDDDTSRTIDVEACQNGYEVLEKALRKFGKWGGLARGGPPGLSESESETDETDCLDVDGWGVFLQKNDDGRFRSYSQG
jgi:mitogen-activated protein kinase kinase kinase